MAPTAKMILIVGLAFGLAACDGRVLETATDREAQGSEFDKELYVAYVELSEREYAEADYVDSDRFANRAITASGGELVRPELVSARAIPEDRKPILAASRERLAKALDDGGRDQAPREAARAQTNFDCWMQEQEENRQPDDIAFCQENFTTFIEVVEKTIAPPRAIDRVPPAAAVMSKAEARRFTVFFDFDSAALDDRATASLMSAAATIKGIAGARASVGGHTDTSGPAAYNAQLARIRADAVAKLLMDDGIDGAMLRVAAFGQTRPAVHTGDGVRNGWNRRVEIVVIEP